MPLESLPQPITLARAANRHRHRLRSEDPKIINFTLSHEHLPNGFLQRDIVADDCRHLIFATGHMLDAMAKQLDRSLYYSSMVTSLSRALLCILTWEHT